MKLPSTLPASAFPKRILCIVTVCLGLAALAQAEMETVSLVKDIDQAAEREGSTPRNLVVVNGVTYFTAYTHIHGFELWKSDGTTAGTVMVRDIRPGIESSNPSDLVNMNGTLFFYASDGVSEYGLWKTDGTAEGTVLVKNIQAGDRYPAPPNLVNVNGTLFFRAIDSTLQSELWKSDGTTEGTVMVKDIEPFGSSRPYNLVNVNGTLFFTASTHVTGVELWKSDGTAEGTVMVRDIVPGNGNSYPRSLVNVNGTLFFTADDDVSGRELWKSDGTEEGTVMVKDIRPGTAGSEGSNAISRMLDVSGTLFFTANDGTSGTELWKSDGTAEGTVMVKDIWPGNSDSLSSNQDDKLLNVNGVVFFAANNGVSGMELWKSDGTPDGTVVVREVALGGGSFPRNLENVNGTVFFSAYKSGSSTELWKSDGTPEGTVMVREIAPGTGTSNPSNLINANGTLLFTATDGVSGVELWKSNGTEQGTVMVKDIRVNNGSSSPTSATNVNGTLFFRAYHSASGYELWKSDGTPEGTLMVKDIWPGIGINEINYSPSHLVNVNGTLYFSASSNTSGVELWKSDGTAQGTVMVKDLAAGGGHSFPTNLVNVDGTLFFGTSLGYPGFEIWKSDGTSAGTVMVKAMTDGTIVAPQNFVNVNGTLFFTLQSAATGLELWKSDGTEAGTIKVRELSPGNGLSGPYSHIVYKGMLYFVASDGVSGFELWKSDGTAEGTVMVKDIAVGADNSYPGELAVHNDTLFFHADDHIHGVELWKSDGTADGTVLVSDIDEGLSGSWPSKFVSCNGTLFFRGYKPESGYELWKTDGTAEGTVLVKDIAPGQFSSAPSNALAYNGRLYFQATDGVSGEELWRSDGTPEGTVLVAELYPGETGSTPGLFAVGSQLFIAARQPDIGIELFAISKTPAITDGGAAAVTAADAVISVVVPSSGIPTSVHVEYGTSASLGMSTAVQVTDGMTEQTLTFTLSGLPVGTAYFYRVVATNSLDTHNGEVRTFTTAEFAFLTAESGAPAPGAGEPDGPPAGTVIRRFGVPAISDTRKLAAKVTLSSGRKLMEGIYVKEQDGSTSLPAVQNGAVPGVEDGIFKSFLDPQLSPAGALGFSARIKGEGISASNDEGLWSDVFGNGLEPVLREGSEVPETGGALLKAVPSFSLRDGELLASVTLARGRGGVTPRNDTALLRIDASGTKVLLREGEPFAVGAEAASKITQISVLQPAAGSPGHGRSHADNGQGVAKITLANKKQVGVRWNAEGDIVPVLATGTEAAEVAAGAQWNKLGLPAIGTDGSGVVTYGQLKAGLGGVSKRDDAALVYTPPDAPSQAIAREGMDAPGMSGIAFKAFLDPVSGSSGEIAFMATLNGRGINRANQSSLWWGTAESIELVAQQGASATDENGMSVPSRFWASFVSYALPAGAGVGPIFVAKVRGEGVNAKSNVGLWAVDSKGLVRELVRTGAEVETEAGLKKLKNFSLLTAPSGSFGATRSFNATGAVVIQAAFDDKTQAILRFDLP